MKKHNFKLEEVRFSGNAHDNVVLEFRISKNEGKILKLSQYILHCITISRQTRLQTVDVVEILKRTSFLVQKHYISGEGRE
jgi:hypothetical protein